MASLAGPGLSIDDGLLRTVIAEATNLGDGDGVFAAVENGVLGFRSLEGGNNVSLSSTDSEITINASSSSSTSSGESNTASNVGTGDGWFKQKSGTDLEFRTLTTQGALTATQNTDTVSLGGPWADADADGLLEPRSGTGFNGIDLSGAASPQVVTPWAGTTGATAFEAFVNGTRVAHFGTEGTDLDGNTAAGNVAFGQHTQIGDSAVGVVVAGGGSATTGYENVVYDDYATISGGKRNQAGSSDGDSSTAVHATVGGGRRNTASADAATVGGGRSNTASGLFSTVGGGYNNAVSGESATIAGGYGHSAGGQDSTVAGGSANTASGYRSTVGGGRVNTAQTMAATVGGGIGNDAKGGHQPVIAGGLSNTVNGKSSTVGGGQHNDVQADFATIAGGGPTDLANPSTTNNAVFDNYGAIGGGGNNRVGSDDGDSTTAEYATVAGGQNNGAYDIHCTVGGGEQNKAGSNDSTSNHPCATVGGGWGNTADAQDATIAGGSTNSASAYRATVGGGGVNNITAKYGTVPGGNRNDVNGSWGFAAGHRAKADNTGAFVWADSQDWDFESDTDYNGSGVTGADTFHVRAQNGARIVNSAGTTYIPSGSTGWTQTSTETAKTNFQPVDTREVLAGVQSLDISTWEYKDDEGEGAGVEHMGPMAEAFDEAFSLGDSDRHINSINADGVALAAIQGAAERVDELERDLARKDDQIAELEAEREAHEDRIDDLEAELESKDERLDRLVERLDHVEQSLDGCE